MARLRLRRQGLGRLIFAADAGAFGAVLVARLAPALVAALLLAKCSLCQGRPGSTPTPVGGRGGAHQSGGAQGASARALRENHHLQGFQENDQIQEQRQILDVVEIVLQLLQGVFDRRRIGIADLGPAGDPRSHRVPT